MGCPEVCKCLQKVTTVFSCIFGFLVLIVAIIFLVVVIKVGDEDVQKKRDLVCELGSKTDEDNVFKRVCNLYKEWTASCSIGIVTGLIQVAVAGALFTSIDRRCCLWIVLHVFILILCVAALALLLHGRVLVTGERVCAGTFGSREGGEKIEHVVGRAKDDKPCATGTLKSDEYDVDVYNAFFVLLVLDVVFVTIGVIVVAILSCFINRPGD